MVCENTYHRKNEEELREMFTERGNRQENGKYDYDVRMKAFCERKYSSDFSVEMSRSVAKYIETFLKSSR